MSAFHISYCSCYAASIPSEVDSVKAFPNNDALAKYTVWYGLKNNPETLKLKILLCQKQKTDI